MNPRHPQVALRAGHRCEYCHAPAVVFNFLFEVEHVMPVARDGTDDMANLALACRSCNAHKSARIEGVDPEQELVVRLFHPREDVWEQHFHVETETALIKGLSDTGRATIVSLEMNNPYPVRGPAILDSPWSLPMTVPKHIVAVAGLVSDAQGRVLMIRSPRRDWEFPGGQVEEGESLMDALRREILEETGVTISVGALAGVYSNIKSHIVMFDFLCDLVGCELATSAESPEVAWVERNEALARIIRPAIRDRMRDMLEFDGQIVYRAYTFDANEVLAEYTVHEERCIS